MLIKVVTGGSFTHGRGGGLGGLGRSCGVLSGVGE